MKPGDPCFRQKSRVFSWTGFSRTVLGVFQKSKNTSGWCRNSGGLGIFLTTQVAWMPTSNHADIHTGHVCDGDLRGILRSVCWQEPCGRRRALMYSITKVGLKAGASFCLPWEGIAFQRPMLGQEECFFFTSQKESISVVLPVYRRWWCASSTRAFGVWRWQTLCLVLVFKWILSCSFLRDPLPRSTCAPKFMIVACGVSFKFNIASVYKSCTVEFFKFCG